MIDAAKDPSRCLWHIWTDDAIMSQLNRFHDNFPAINVILSLPDSISDVDQLLKQSALADMLKDYKFMHTKPDYKKWKDEALHFEKFKMQ